ncbi:unnamed protein product [Caenorhabditis angaria]|uniref:G-protein coupled receptors family 1 profile domain-containing protein n=1 Tax=Caenorhabditis angaria TaxID=860376 RepID=A0A9P1J3X7_9PELO|nr:unnamed protein product [Caenorhabditis angaria]
MSELLANLTALVPEGCDANTSVFLFISELVQDHIVELERVHFSSDCYFHCGLCQPPKDPYYIQFNFMVLGVILPIVGLFGIFGNAISAFVYSRPEMQCTTNFYLCLLACSDAGVVLTGIFLFSLESYKPFSLTATRIIGAFSPIVFPMGTIAQTSSVYFTMCAGIDCFVQVCTPEKVRRVFSRKNTARFLAMIVLVFCILYNVPHFFEGRAIDCWQDEWKGMSQETCPLSFRFNELYQQIYYKYMYSVFIAVGPLALLIVLNSFIIGFSVFGKTDANTDDTMSLILVVLLFISCNTIALIINIFEDMLSGFLEAKINYIVDLSNFLVVFNSSFNIVIYMKYSQPFASTMRSYFCRRKPKSESPGPGPPIMITEKPSRSKSGINMMQTRIIEL